MPKSESYGSFFINMGFRTLFIRDSEKLNLYLDNIVIQAKEGELRFLISDLKCLIIENYKTTISVQLINKLAENNVALIICDMSHLPFVQMLPISNHYLASGMVYNQISWNIETKSRLHKLIVKNKIESQITVLSRNSKSMQIIQRMNEYKNEIEDGDPTNREGLASKLYFHEMFGKDFVRFDEDIINAGLNYGYAVFRALISSIIVSKGLLSSIGIFHRGKSNSNNLSDDIIEIYRPIVDEYVYNNLMEKEILTKEDRENLIKLLDCKIEFAGQMHSINNTVEMYVESIIRCFDDDDISEFMCPSIRRLVYAS